jgi:branched-chain amino acid transport system substrate-binding protein
MTKKRISWISLMVVGLLIISVLMMFGCGKTTSAPAPATSTAAPAPAPAPVTTAAPAPAPATTQPPPVSSAQPAVQILPIGFIYNSQMSVDALHSIQIMIELQNKAGGLKVGDTTYQLKLIDYDDNAQQSQAVSAANRLIYQDKVKFITGDFLLVDSYIDLCEQNHVVLAAGTPSLITVKPQYNYAFVGEGRNFEIGEMCAWFAQTYPDAVKNYVFVAPDNQNGHFTVDTLMAPMLKALKVNYQGIFYPASQTDLSAVATKVLSLNPTNVDCTGGGTLMDINAMKAVYGTGYKGMLFTTGSVDPKTATEFLTAEALSGSISSTTATTFEPALTQYGKDLKAAWIAKYGKWESPMVNVDEYLALAAAMQQAGSIDVDKVMAVVHAGMKFNGLNGPSMMVERPDLGPTGGKTRDSVHTVIIQKYEGKTPVVLTKINPEDAMKYYSAIDPAFK